MWSYYFLKIHDLSFVPVVNDHESRRPIRGVSWVVVAGEHVCERGLVVAMALEAWEVG